MFNVFSEMSPLLLFIGITLALIVATVIFHIGMHLSDNYKIKHGIVEDMSLKNTFTIKYHRVPHTVPRILIGNALLIATGIMVILTCMKLTNYGSYGAFYDDSWKIKDVEDHFYFLRDDDDKLLEIYNSDPTNFNFETWNVVIVRFGCQECEAMAETIKSYDNEGFYVIFSRSEIGKKFKEHYDINYVPCIISEGQVQYLKTGIITDAPIYEPGEAKEDVQDILNLKDQIINQNNTNTETSTNDVSE